MSYGSSSSSSIAHVQGQLESLLQRLSWSYAAFWSFNNQSRSLLWRGGHFRGSSTAGIRRGDAEVWSEQLFGFTYKACTFTPGQGPVGMAYAENKSVWMNGASAQRSSGSKEQAQFLQHARIETVVCIPCAQSVLELGTCENLVENVNLVDSISAFMRENILPALQGRVGAPQSPLAATSMMQLYPVPLLRHESEKFLGQHFELNLLTEEIRRTASLNSDVVLPQPEEGERKGPERGNAKSTGPSTSDIAPWKEPRWRSPSTTTRIGSADMTNLQAQMKPPMPAAAAAAAGPDINTSHPGAALMSTRWCFPYASISPHSGTPSSSVSSLEESSALVLSVVDSPEQSASLMASAAQLQRRNSHSFTGSSAGRETPSHSPEIQPGRDSAISTAALLPPPQNLLDIQQAIRHMLDEPSPIDTQEQWPQLYMDPCLGASDNSMHEMNLLNSGEAMQHGSGHMGSFQAHQEEEELNQPQTVSSVGLWREQPPRAFTAWQHTNHGLQQKMKGTSAQSNQCLLRRCFEMMKRIPKLQRGHGAQETSSGPESMPDQAGPSTSQRRARGGARIQAITGPVHAGHDDAAQMHMMSERRRRLKQKENFEALRKLVPIISKNDKASILGDAIVYLKDLQAQIKELEARKTQMESQYESLKLSHEQLEQRNKELEAMAAGATTSGKSLPHREDNPTLSP